MDTDAVQLAIARELALLSAGVRRTPSAVADLLDPDVPWRLLYHQGTLTSET